MHAYLEAFDALQDLVLLSQNEYKKITVGSLPAEDSIVIAPAAGISTNEDLAHHGDLDMDFVLNAKHKDQRAVISALMSVHHTITRMHDLPKGEGWQLLSVSTSATPTFIEHDGDQFLYGSGLRVVLYLE